MIKVYDMTRSQAGVAERQEIALAVCRAQECRLCLRNRETLAGCPDGGGPIDLRRRLDHNSKIEQLEPAFAALGKRISPIIENVARQRAAA